MFGGQLVQLVRREALAVRREWVGKRQLRGVVGVLAVLRQVALLLGGGIAQQGLGLAAVGPQDELAVAGNGDAGEQGQDGYHHHQFDQGESAGFREVRRRRRGQGFHG